MKKRFYLFCLLLSMYVGAQAQVELVPITENTVLQRYFCEKQVTTGKQRPTAIEKNTCGNLEKPGNFYVQTGDTLAIKLEIDTAGLGEGIYSCVACQFITFGTPIIANDTLYYIAGTTTGQDRVQVNFCNNAGACRNRFYNIVTRRPGQTRIENSITIRSGQTDTLTLSVSNLPVRKAACGTILENCAGSYNGGGQQRAYFTEANQIPVNGKIAYAASRFPGLDTVCVVLCDTFAVCDTFRLPVRVTSDTLLIPFMDDFSYFGPYPNDSHWLDLEVFINNDMADTPPSWGVATFDGLNSNGTAYGGGYGSADQLTSKAINLANITQDVFFTYWVQRRGFGDRPEVQDSFLVEFKNRRGDWILVDSLAGAPSNQSDTAASPFLFRSIKISNDFKYNAFQFRFRNKSDRTGLLDTWHLDYVRIDRNARDSLIDDIAFTSHPNFILKRYSSMPWKQFRGFEFKELVDGIKVGVWNHGPDTLRFDNSFVELEENISNINLFNDIKLFNGQQSEIASGGPVSRNYLFENDPNEFPALAYSSLKKEILNPILDNYNFLSFRLTYGLSNDSELNASGYESIKRNNSVNRDTYFSNYFSYDDGTAEAGLVARQNVEVAVRYILNKSDTIRAVQYHFPRTTVDISTQRFTIKVWVGKLDDTPEYELTGQQAYYTDIYFDTLQGFTTYPLMNANGVLTPLALPTDTIYVGWEQETACDGTRCIPVGYDRNVTNGFAHTFRRSGSQAWQPFPPITPGSLMIRPVVGNVTPLPTATDEVQKPTRNFVLYPNPTREILNITSNQSWYEDFQYLLFSSTGQLLQQGILQPQLSVNDLPPGMYFLKIADRQTNQFWNERFIIAR